MLRNVMYRFLAQQAPVVFLPVCKAPGHGKTSFSITKLSTEISLSVSKMYAHFLPSTNSVYLYLIVRQSSARYIPKIPHPGPVSSLQETSFQSQTVSSASHLHNFLLQRLVHYDRLVNIQCVCQLLTACQIWIKGV